MFSKINSLVEGQAPAVLYLEMLARRAVKLGGLDIQGQHFGRLLPLKLGRDTRMGGGICHSFPSEEVGGEKR